jgi:hypothetical protein
MNDDLTRGDEDTLEPDAPDPLCGVYANVPKEGHALKPIDNCEFCNAKKFEYEPPGFCCRIGAIHLSTPRRPRMNSCDCVRPLTLMLGIFVTTSDILMGTSPSLLCTVILMVRPPTLGSLPYTPSVRMAPFTIILKTLAKKISMNLITSSFISTMTIVILIIGSASVVRRLNRKTERLFVRW